VTPPSAAGDDPVVSEYLTLNRAWWDEKAPAHVASADYGVGRFASDPEHLSDVVRFDLPRLGDVAGLRGVHLQCHVGTDTVSLARLGARMTGLDFSPESVRRARAIAETAGVEVDFVESDVYAATEVLPAGTFDLVYTGIGALCWLPSVTRWAGVVAELLAPGGRLFLREGHPMLWALADARPDGLLVVDHPYFELADPTVWDAPGTYVQTGAEFAHHVTHEWNHGLGEIVTALLGVGLTVTALEEHDSAPWDAMPGWTEAPPEHPGEFRLRDRPWRVPFTYTLQALKPA
jgi:SAM-dependent methyltransferase